MHKELPLYVFIRNTVILCLLFFVISFVIIERGRIERGENSLFNGIIIDKNNIRDYNNSEFSSSTNSEQEYQVSDSYLNDSLNQQDLIMSYTSSLFDNNEVDLGNTNEVGL